MKKRIAILLAVIGCPSVALAEWTPLITDSMFTGIRTDMLVAVGGILGLALIVFGLSMIMRVSGR